MRNLPFILLLVTLLFFSFLKLDSQSQRNLNKNVEIDKVQALLDTLQKMMVQTDNELFINHCKSFISVINAQQPLTSDDTYYLSLAYDAFCNNQDTSNSRKLASYLKRQRSLIMSWYSPTDANISFSYLTLPKDWDPEKAYPVYILLHGLWEEAGEAVRFMTYYYRIPPSASFAFEDGYLLMPWGRGNLWYQGISETDIWECKSELENLVKIDGRRQYITGHSMGGYGAWSIASSSANTWAALGIYAGALTYNNETLLSNEVIQQLKDLPAYFVCGTYDGLFDVNQRAYNLLNYAGNPHTKFVTFEGAHDYLQINVENMYMWLKDFVKEDYVINDESVAINPAVLDCKPNPFQISTNIEFNLESSDFVTLSIFNIEGQLIETLINNTLPQGLHTVNFSPPYSVPGLFLCILKVGRKQYIQKLMFIK
jgi:predicted esterase